MPNSTRAAHAGEALPPSFLILHGIDNLRPPEHWQRWLAGRLRDRGLEVRYPGLPDPHAPRFDRWREATMEIAMDLPDPRVVVCHSLACLLWLRIAGESPDLLPVDHLLLVAPPEDDSLPEAGHEFRLGRPAAAGVRASVRGSVRIVRGTEDPYSPNGQPTWAAAIGAEVDELPGVGHVVPEDGHGPWESCERWCLDPRRRISA